MSRFCYVLRFALVSGVLVGLLNTAMAAPSTAPYTVQKPNLDEVHEALLPYLTATSNQDVSSTTTAKSNSSLDFQRGIVEQAGNIGRGVGSIVDKAVGFLGTPYRYGGTSAVTGFDCSGFVQAVFAKINGINLPRTAAAQAQATTKIDKTELRPGDLVFFNTMRRSFSHVGIYVGEGKFVHAPRTGRSVSFASMNNSYWAARFDGARRVISS